MAATYSNRGNPAQAFAVKNQLKEIRQGERDGTRYFNQLKTLWQELDQFVVIEWESPKDSACYQRLLEKDCIYDFLSGLNPEFEAARERVLGTEPLQSILEIFAYIKREECRRGAMSGLRPAATIEKSALLVEPGENALTNRSRSSMKRPYQKSNLWCEHCNKPRHTKETCWQLHGKPANLPNRNSNQRKFGRNSGPNRAYAAGTEHQLAGNPPFTPEQFDWLT